MGRETGGVPRVAPNDANGAETPNKIRLMGAKLNGQVGAVPRFVG